MAGVGEGGYAVGGLAVVQVPEVALVLGVGEQLVGVLRQARVVPAAPIDPADAVFLQPLGHDLDAEEGLDVGLGYGQVVPLGAHAAVGGQEVKQVLLLGADGVGRGAVEVPADGGDVPVDPAVSRPAVHDALHGQGQGVKAADDDLALGGVAVDLLVDVAVGRLEFAADVGVGVEGLLVGHLVDDVGVVPVAGGHGAPEGHHAAEALGVLVLPGRVVVDDGHHAGAGGGVDDAVHHFQEFGDGPGVGVTRVAVFEPGADPAQADGVDPVADQGGVDAGVEGQAQVRADEVLLADGDGYGPHPAAVQMAEGFVVRVVLGRQGAAGEEEG